MSCQVKENCWNNPDGCWMCKYENPEETQGWYSAIDKKIKHPQAIKDKEDAKRKTKIDKVKAKSGIDKKKVKLLAEANKAEERVKSTLNSGRAFRDGDLSTGEITIDVKMQSKNVNPIIFAAEFRKVQNDAKNAGNRHGILVLENSLGETFYVISGDLFKEMVDD